MTATVINVSDRPEMALFQPSADELRRRVGADTEVLARPDLLLATRPVPDDPWASGVYCVRWDEHAVDARITEVLDFFRARRRGFVWLVSDGSTPASLGTRLTARGFIRELDGRMLVAPLPITGLRVNPAVRVEEVTDRARMERALRVDHPSWDDARLAPILDDRVRRLGGNWHVALAYLDGRPVGTARWFIDRSLGALELTGAETLPEYRSRGVYSTLVAYRAAHAVNEGCTFVGIIADERTSAPILLKRGFEDLGDATFFLWPASRF